jgi:hypothetical protein
MFGEPHDGLGCKLLVTQSTMGSDQVVIPFSFLYKHLGLMH